MKFLPLVWAGLWRKPVRSALTAICIVIAFVLLGLLQGVNAGFARAIANARRDLLVTTTRVRGGAPMPIAAMAAMLRIQGVKEVAPRAYFIGTYRDPGLRNSVAAIATEPQLFFRMLPGLRLDPRYLDALRDTRMGMLVTPALLQSFQWKVGERVTLHSTTLKADGSSDWTFDIVGTFDTPSAAGRAYFGVINYDYLDEYRVANRGTADTFYVRIADPTRAIAMSAAIDRIFANSPHETRTRSQQIRAEAQARQMGDVEFFTDAIMGAVLFMLAFVTGNTLRQALQERARDFAVLEAFGYAVARILAITFAEALLLCLPPAAVGLLIARLLAPLAREDIGAIVVSPTVAAAGLACAAVLAFAGAALPASKLARAPIAAELNRG